MISSFSSDCAHGELVGWPPRAADPRIGFMLPGLAGADRGSLEAGKRSDLVVWQVPEHGMVINRFGVNLVDAVVKNGRVVWRARA